jgi:hypothetical protein
MLEGILPTIGRDLERFKLLRETLQVHAGDMQRCIVVVPDQDMSAFRGVIGSDPFYDLRSERAVLGRKVPKYLMHWQKRRPCRAGWYIQQIIKLQCVSQSTAEFCLTLDADLVAVRKIENAHLVRDGRAVDQVLDRGDEHDAWYRGSSRVLGPGMQRTGVEHPVTPTLMSPVACRQLIKHLAGRVRPVIERDWIGMLMNRVPWSEYTLYYTFLERKNLFDQFHVIVNEPLVYDPFTSVWKDEQLASWDPSRRHAETTFLVVQSTSNAAIESVRNKLVASQAAAA